ncbi:MULTISPECIES: LLM class F420-dependent oxidoreductase [Thermomonospora]|uniref:Luciferase-like monooxygenase n=1 Tax=Thermomonospora curvata (strain ATCC 19995 / DSM 43183 / JCM 3096 / KCTC 9072 / NBRC 15933 / NCIMB 10081 / Henssen B9) TaxID=471852 RepID=D1AE80_THECD|nr:MULTISPECIES: LLM class F420-dependent oxidoreductase [Thermomonospora]ACY99506.1 Luciferase-like monooxygenase [Thermomonospora curvata DSM 43183]PKK12548.1 MAG: LLM class F420-dependent oxidoreductase [Thermomonospora sp. CIF 1]
MTARWGLTVPMTGVPLAEHRQIVTELTDLGYTDVWSAETNGADGFTPLALSSQWGPDLRLGTAIVPVYTRGPALLAQQAATLASLAPGRFVLGIGSSSDTIVQRWNGIPFTEPYQRVRDTLRFLRKALTGEKVSDEALGVQGFKLDAPPPQQPPIVLAALRPGMLRLAAREADGAITNWLAPHDVRTVRGVLGEEPELLARLFVCPTDDAEKARATGRWMIAAYMNVPVYRAFHQWLGRGDALKPMNDAWDAGDRKAALEAIPDEVVDDLIVHGSPAACRDRIRQYVEAGLTTPILAVVPGSGMSPLEAVRALAPSAG